MSEYQYYEFQTIDRPLTAEQQAAIRKLSSRVELTATRAAFNYSYSSLRGEPLAILEQYFDALLYIANWGSKQLAFRFPQGAIAEERLRPYFYTSDDDDHEELVTFNNTGQYSILNIELNEEPSDGWIEGDGMLDPLIPLREAILRDDMRSLYLIWLRSAVHNADDAAIEPPVPAGLGQLDAALQALIEFFEIDPDLVAAAAEASPKLTVTSEPLERWLTLLPETERNAFLLRVARGETTVGVELLRRLREVGGTRSSAPPTQGPRRSFADLEAAAKGQKQQRAQREQRAAERTRLAKLDDLAQREQLLWASIPGRLALRSASGYEQAVALLADLRDLAVHRNQRAAFDARLAEVIRPYASSAALQKRLRAKGMRLE